MQVYLTFNIQLMSFDLIDFQDLATCPEYTREWQYYAGSEIAEISGWQNDIGNDALARCSDCSKYPAEPECCKINTKIYIFAHTIPLLVSCCNEVTVNTSTSSVLSSYLGTYTYNSADNLVGDRKIYKNGDRCLYFNSNIQRWLMTGCTNVGSNSNA